MNDAVTGWPTYDRSATHVSVAGGMRPGVVIEEEPELTTGGSDVGTAASFDKPEEEEGLASLGADMVREFPGFYRDRDDTRIDGR